MKTISVQQGTPDWHVHRATHFNASDAPAMMGISPYKKRDQLLQEMASGLAPEIDKSTQRLFDQGHSSEALARPLAEKIVGEELFPCVGVTNDNRFSASFDGLTMLGNIAFEHKLLNKKLSAVFSQIDSMPKELQDQTACLELPEHYRLQMEHQAMVSGAESILFMASKWENDQLIQSHHCWYYPDHTLRERLIAGWKQFQEDVLLAREKMRGKLTVPVPVGMVSIASAKEPTQLPALRIEITGVVNFSNLADFKSRAMQALDVINIDLKSDNDFVHAEEDIKWCKKLEDRLSRAKEQVLNEVSDIKTVIDTINQISELTKQKRLTLDKSIKSKKETLRIEIVNTGVQELQAHYANINTALGVHGLAFPASVRTQIGIAIKGKKTLASIKDAVHTAVATLKIEANQEIEKIRSNISILDEYAAFDHLFPDRVEICATKTQEDMRNLIEVRIAEQKQKIQKQTVISEAPGLINIPPSQTPKREELQEKITIATINQIIAPFEINVHQANKLGLTVIDCLKGSYSIANIDITSATTVAVAMSEKANALATFLCGR